MVATAATLGWTHREDKIRGEFWKCMNNTLEESGADDTSSEKKETCF
jgi:hypothetical protein